MALSVIEDKCRLDGGKIVIVVHGENPSEVLSSAAKSLAMTKAASLGYGRLGFNGHSGSYPVDAKGETHEDWNKQARDNQIAGYRNNITLMGGI